MPTSNYKIIQLKTDYGVYKTIEGDLVTKQLLDYSAHCRNELAMLSHFLKEGDNMLDIGAHIGAFSIPLVIKLNKKIKIFSFEPQKEIFNLLQENVASNVLSNYIKCFEGVVSSSSQSFKKVMDPNNSMACFFIPGESTSSLTSYHLDVMASQGEIPSDIDAIKIDVEGAEADVFKSCQDIINANLPIIYTEINTTALKRFNTTVLDLEQPLSDLGYHFFRNIGDRNSSNDTFDLVRLAQLSDGGGFYDFIAIHKASNRYPFSAADNYYKIKNDSILKRGIKKLVRLIKS